MVKIQPCRNNCKKLITVQLDEQDQKYKPYEVDSEGNVIQLHNCPNSEYNKKNNLTWTAKTASIPSQQEQQKTVQSIPINNPTLEAVILNQISQKLDIIKKGMEEAIEAKLTEILEYCKNCHLMDDAMIAHFGITQPTTAAELYKKQMEQQGQQNQQEEKKVYGWNSTPNPTDIRKDEDKEDQEDKELEDQGI